MTRLLHLRLLWSCTLTEGGDGYYYHEWTHLFGTKKLVFAGYNKKALNRKSSTFKTVIAGL